MVSTTRFFSGSRSGLDLERGGAERAGCSMFAAAARDHRDCAGGEQAITENDDAGEREAAEKEAHWPKRTRC